MQHFFTFPDLPFFFIPQLRRVPFISGPFTIDFKVFFCICSFEQCLVLCVESFLCLAWPPFSGKWKPNSNSVLSLKYSEITGPVGSYLLPFPWTNYVLCAHARIVRRFLPLSPLPPACPLPHIPFVTEIRASWAFLSHHGYVFVFFFLMEVKLV